MKLLAPFMLFLAFAIRANACSCIIPPPVSVALAKSDFVFHGRCVSFSIHSEDTRIARFEVTRSFKGRIEKKVIDVATSIDSASCGYGFVAGDYYLVYGYASDGVFRTNICTRTRELYLTHAEDDAEYVALSMMVGSPSEKWKDFDPIQGAGDPFLKPNSEIKKPEPNKAMEPTPVSVTVPACAGTAPLTSVAHLKRWAKHESTA